MSVELLVDRDWYRRRYPDVAAAGADPLAHFLDYGWREGRDPGPLFDTDWYLNAYRDVAAAGVNPVAHFVAHGAAELRRPNPLFDPHWYVNEYPQVGETGWEPFTHYVLVGREQGLSPGPAVAAASARGPVTPLADRPGVTVVIPAGGDFVHVDRCVSALAVTEAAGWADVVVVNDTAVERPWHFVESYPGVRVVGHEQPVEVGAAVDDVVSRSDSEFVLLLSPDTEPTPGFLHALIRRYRDGVDGASGDDVLVTPRDFADLTSGGDDIDHPDYVIRAATTALLMNRRRWTPRTPSEPSEAPVVGAPPQLLDLLDVGGAHLVAAPDGIVLTHQAFALEVAAEEALARSDAVAAEALLVRATELDPTAYRYSQLVKFHLGAANPWGAAHAHARWGERLSRMTSAGRRAEVRHVLTAREFVGDVVNESLLDEEGARQARAAVLSNNVRQAARVVSEHPECLPAANGLISLLRHNGQLSTVPPRRVGPAIPKVLCQAWFAPPVPPDALEFARRWQDFHPAWDYHLFDRDDAVTWLAKHHGERAVAAFEAAPHNVARADLFRLAHVATRGGVWSDIDNFVTQPIDPLLAGRSLLLWREPLGGVGGDFIAATPEHPVITTALEEAIRNLIDGYHETTWLATACALITRATATWLATQPDIGADGTDYLLDDGLLTYVWPWQELDYKKSTVAWDLAESSGDDDQVVAVVLHADSVLETVRGLIPVHALRAADGLRDESGGVIECLSLAEGAAEQWISLGAGALGAGTPSQDTSLPSDLVIHFRDRLVDVLAVADGLPAPGVPAGPASSQGRLLRLSRPGTIRVDGVRVAVGLPSDEIVRPLRARSRRQLHIGGQ